LIFGSSHGLLSCASRSIGGCGLHASFKVVLKDPNDEILNTAYSGRAEFIVTGDRHLLVLEKFKKTKIININQMLVAASISFQTSRS
jgi:predicted nucleic acid-binding protein